MYIVYSSPNKELEAIVETRTLLKAMTTTEEENYVQNALFDKNHNVENKIEDLAKKRSDMEQKYTKTKIIEKINLGAAYLVIVGGLGYFIYKQKYKNNTYVETLHMQHNTTNTSHINITSDNTQPGIVPTVSSQNDLAVKGNISNNKSDKPVSKSGKSVSKSSTSVAKAGHSVSKSSTSVAKAGHSVSCILEDFLYSCRAEFINLSTYFF